MSFNQNTNTTWAEWLYGLLLWLYPNKHRQDYGVLMTQLFLDQLRDARLEGPWSVLVLWLRTIVDVLKSAPGEHLKNIIPAPNRPLLSWRGAVVMVLPALLLMSPYLPTGKGLMAVVGLLAVVILVATLVAWKRTRRVPIWGMPLLGMVITPLVWCLAALPNGIISGFFSLRSSLTGTEQVLLYSSLVVFNILQVSMIIGLFVYYARRHVISRPAWLMFGAYVVGMAAISTIRSNQANMSISFLFVASSSFLFLFELLLPVAIGLLLARRQGLDALLFAISGMTFFQVSFDVDYHFAFISGNIPAVTVYNIVWRLLVFVVAPMWMVRARTDRSRLLGIAGPLMAALVIETAVNTLIDPWIFQVHFLHYFMVTVVQPPLAIMVAFMFYRQGGEKDISMSGNMPVLTSEAGV
ncbi:MAG: hypothetical protein JXB07_21125 [Anaerolineae bacterium]|nr:hypothetical protein [Anaerolineae bacterium]